MKLVLQKFFLACVLIHCSNFVFAMHEDKKETFQESDSARENAAIAQLITTLESEYKKPIKKSPEKQRFNDLRKAAFELDLEKTKKALEDGASIEYGKKSSLNRVIDGLVSKMHRILLWDRNAEEIQKAKQEAYDVLKFLIDSGANVNLQNKEGGTSLMQAGFYVQPDIVDLLIKSGADRHLTTKDGLIAWYNAAVGSKSAAQRCLPETGNPFYYEIFSYEKYEEDRQRCVDLLKPEEGSSSYDNYCKYLQEEANEGKLELLAEATLGLDVDKVKQMLDEGVNFKLARRYTLESPVFVLLYGTAHGYVEFVKKIEKDYQSETDYPSLVAKAMSRSREIARLLVNNGLDVDTAGPVRRTALMIGASSANIGLVEELLSLGAQRDLRDYLGASAFDYTDVSSEPFKSNLQNKEFIEFATRYSLICESQKLKEVLQSNDTQLEKKLWRSIESLESYKAVLQKIHSLLLEKEIEAL